MQSCIYSLHLLYISQLKAGVLWFGRLAGAGLIAPVVNYWWPGFPANLSAEAYNLQFPEDQWALSVAHHAPWLVYWWNTQTWFPYSSVIAGRANMSRQDKEIISKLLPAKKMNKVLCCLNSRILLALGTMLSEFKNHISMLVISV